MAPAQPEQPRLLAGRYRLFDQLGRGGMADVYRGQDEVLVRPVAVKVFRTVPGDADRRRYETEVRTLARLHHPGLVVLFDAGTDRDGRPYAVMQLVEGPSLADRPAGQRLPVHRVASLGRALAEALAFVHAHDVVHRDVKPANVLLDENDFPLLADFGIARTLDTTGVTGTGLTVGTAAYMAPEQVRGETVSGAADVYALGLVLLECLSGEREYQGSAVEAALARLTRAPRLPADLPAAWRTLLRQMTETDPALRPAAAQVAQQLRADRGFLGRRAGGAEADLDAQRGGRFGPRGRVTRRRGETDDPDAGVLPTPAASRPPSGGAPAAPGAGGVGATAGGAVGGAAAAAAGGAAGGPRIAGRRIQSRVTPRNGSGVPSPSRTDGGTGGSARPDRSAAAADRSSGAAARGNTPTKVARPRTDPATGPGARRDAGPSGADPARRATGSGQELPRGAASTDGRTPASRATPRENGPLPRRAPGVAAAEADRRAAGFPGSRETSGADTLRVESAQATAEAAETRAATGGAAASASVPVDLTRPAARPVVDLRRSEPAETALDPSVTQEEPAAEALAPGGEKAASSSAARAVIERLAIAERRQAAEAGEATAVAGTNAAVDGESRAPAAASEARTEVEQEPTDLADDAEVATAAAQAGSPPADVVDSRPAPAGRREPPAAAAFARGSRGGDPEDDRGTGGDRGGRDRTSASSGGRPGAAALAAGFGYWADDEHGEDEAYLGHTVLSASSGDPVSGLSQWKAVERHPAATGNPAKRGNGRSPRWAPLIAGWHFARQPLRSHSPIVRIGMVAFMAAAVAVATALAVSAARSDDNVPSVQTGSPPSATAPATVPSTRTAGPAPSQAPSAQPTTVNEQPTGSAVVNAPAPTARTTPQVSITPSPKATPTRQAPTKAPTTAPTTVPTQPVTTSPTPVTPVTTDPTTPIGGGGGPGGGGGDPPPGDG